MALLKDCKGSLTVYGYKHGTPSGVGHRTLGFSGAARTYSSYVAGSTMKKMLSSAASHCWARRLVVRRTDDTRFEICELRPGDFSEQLCLRL